MTEANKSSKTQLQRREEAINKIIDSAITLISEKGVKDITMAEIGIHAGYSRGLPHQYFASKDLLIEAVLRTIIERFNERRKRDISITEGLDSIKAIVTAYLQPTVNYWRFTKAFILIISDLSIIEGPLSIFIKKHNQRNLDFIIYHLNIAKNNGQISAELPSNDLAILLISALRGLYLQALTDQKLDLNSINSSISIILEKLSLS